MELLYLWVEEYKNIKRQGFNFSPRYRFRFDYQEDGEGNVSGGELKLISENKNYPENFFGENISNITAVVGKNGSGKSSIINFITELRPSMNTVSRISQDKRFYSFLAVYEEDGYHVVNFVNEKTVKIECKEFTPNKVYSISDDFADIDPFYRKLLYNSSGRELISKDRIINISSYSIVVRLLKEIEKDEKERIENMWKKYDYEEFYTQIELIFAIKKQKNLKWKHKIIERFFELNRIKIYAISNFWEEKLDYYFVNLIEKCSNEKMKKLFTKILVTMENANIDANIFRDRKSILFSDNCSVFSSKERMDSIKEIISRDIKSEALYSLIEESEIKDLTEVEKKIYRLYYEKYVFNKKIIRDKNDIKNENDFYLVWFKENWINERILVLINKIKNGKKIENMKFQYKDRVEEFEKHSKEIIEVVEELQIVKSEVKFGDFLKYRKLFKRYSTYFKVEFSQLSTGEKNFLGLFARLFGNIVNQKNYSKEIHIILDEPESFLHPEWQREFLYNLKEFFEWITDYDENLKDVKFFILISSHSPMLISDLPRENIIFLKKDDEGNCKVVDGVNKKETFAANIHTLLSDGFFMESTMGEFAKRKISEVLEILYVIKDREKEEGKKKYKEKWSEKFGEDGEEKYLEWAKKYTEQICNMVGEDIIKYKLEKLWKEVFEDRNFEYYINEIKNLRSMVENPKTSEEQIKKIKDELDKLQDLIDKETR